MGCLGIERVVVSIWVRVGDEFIFVVVSYIVLDLGLVRDLFGYKSELGVILFFRVRWF